MNSITWQDNGKNCYNKENKEVKKYHRITDGGSNANLNHEFYDPRIDGTGYHVHDTQCK